MGNGELLERADSEGCDILVITDQNMRHQQNIADRQLAVVVLLPTDTNRQQTGAGAPKHSLSSDRR